MNVKISSRMLFLIAALAVIVGSLAGWFVSRTILAGADIGEPAPSFMAARSGTRVGIRLGA